MKETVQTKRQKLTKQKQRNQRLLKALEMPQSIFRKFGVSTIYMLDSSIHIAEHERFMQQFEPHADVAASWLFDNAGNTK